LRSTQSATASSAPPNASALSTCWPQNACAITASYAARATPDHVHSRGDAAYALEFDGILRHQDHPRRGLDGSAANVLRQAASIPAFEGEPQRPADLRVYAQALG
jgi:hypothetical protein